MLGGKTCRGRGGGGGGEGGMLICKTQFDVGDWDGILLCSVYW